jgi:hypothetical protein
MRPSLVIAVLLSLVACSKDAAAPKSVLFAVALLSGSARNAQ